MSDQRSLLQLIGVTLITRFLVGCGASVAATAMSPDGIWRIRADMPTGRWELSTCVVDGKICGIRDHPEQGRALLHKEVTIQAWS